jgi:copper(I)-binding protein
LIRLSLLLAVAACALAPAGRQPVIAAPGPSIVRTSPEAGPDIRAAAYVRLANASDAADRLVGASCACADRVEIHNSGGGAMHVLPHLDIPARSDLEVYPGGPAHLMLMGVRKPIAAGEIVTMTLSFSTAADLTVSFVAVENSRDGWAANDPRR